MPRLAIPHAVGCSSTLVASNSPPSPTSSTTVGLRFRGKRGRRLRWSFEKRDRDRAVAASIRPAGESNPSLICCQADPNPLVIPHQMRRGRGMDRARPGFQHRAQVSPVDPLPLVPAIWNDRRQLPAADCRRASSSPLHPLHPHVVTWVEGHIRGEIASELVTPAWPRQQKRQTAPHRELSRFTAGGNPVSQRNIVTSSRAVACVGHDQSTMPCLSRYCRPLEPSGSFSRIVS